MEDPTEMLMRKSFESEEPLDGSAEESVEIRDSVLALEPVDNLPLETDTEKHEKVRDFAQNDRGIRVHMDRSRDALLTKFGKATLSDRYLLPDAPLLTPLPDRMKIPSEWCLPMCISWLGLTV